MAKNLAKVPNAGAMRLLRASLAVAAVAVKPGDYFEEACHEDALTDHDLSHVAEHQHHHPYVHEGNRRVRNLMNNNVRMCCERTMESGYCRHKVAEHHP